MYIGSGKRYGCPGNHANANERDRPMTQYTILYPAMIVHAAGCSDIKRTATKRNVQADTMVNRDAANVAALIAAELEGDLTEMGYTASDFTVSPCAANKPAPKTKAAAKAAPATATKSCTTDGCTEPRIRANALKCTRHELEYRAAAKVRAAARKAAAEKAAMDNAIEYVRLAK